MNLVKLILFNRFARAVLNFNFSGIEENEAPDRVKAFLIDLLYTIAVFIPLILGAALFAKMIQSFGGLSAETGNNLQNALMAVPFYGLYMMLLHKDFYNGQSIVNRLWGYQVVDIKTGSPPDPFKCMLRNLTIIIFPVELLLVLVNQERRLGDFIAGTKLIKVEKRDPESILAEIPNTDFGQRAKLALALSSLLFIVWTI
ncbi:MAG: RDD family protein [Cyclobacteriaceae bacterium]|nr:RDD family protein [Cyclobacteriaceae bacterium]